MAAPPYVSLLTSDEESDDADESATAGLRESGKAMKHVGKRVLQVGKQCMDHFYHVLEEEEREAAAAMKKASVDYHATMDSLHDKYAIEIQKREDALATASAEKKQEVSEAQAEIKRLQDAIVQQQNEAAAKLATVQAEAEATKKAALERAAASEAALKKKKVAPGTLAKDSLEAIIKDVLQSYNDKLAAWMAQQPPAATAAPAAPAIPKPVASVWIMQKNTNPTYLTVRELTCQSKSSKWFFDSSDKKNDPTAQANLTEITHPAAVTALAGLGSFTAVRKIFKPTVGNKITYSVGQHSYEVEVVNSVKPWEEAHYQQQLAAPPQSAAATPTSNLKKHMLLEGPFFCPSKDQIKAYSENLDTSAEMSEVIGHKQLAELATYWSSYSQGFKYDETKTELWVKPKWLSTWLNTLNLKHSDHEVRIVAHGVRTGDFSSLAKDPRGFNLAMCNMGRAKGDGSHGFGIYVSPLDCIPADYTNVSAAHKDGTFVLGLLQVPNPNKTTLHSTSTSGSAYQTANGALEFYHLGSGRNNYLAATHGENDAYNVRDQTLFLTLGMVTTK